MKYVEAYITKQSKPAGNQNNYYPYDKQTKQFKDMKEFKQWLKDEYGKSKRQKMYIDDKDGNAIHIGYVYHYKTNQYEELNNGRYGYKTYYCLDWVEVVEVETHNLFVK